MLFIWFTCAIALTSRFSIFASPLFLNFNHLCPHAQPLLFSLSTEINFLTLSCPSLLSRVCLWQLGWVPIGFMVVQSMLQWFDQIYGGLICASLGFLGLIDFDSCISFLEWRWWCDCELSGWGLWFWVVVIVAVVVVVVVEVEWV